MTNMETAANPAPEPAPLPAGAMTDAAWQALQDEFLARCAPLGVPQLALYHWYHTVDLGNGIVTPGIYDYREALKAFPFPADMRGMEVLDIGSATGFFAFEFERRGATVTSVELPSLHHLDRFPGQDLTQILRRLASMRVPESLLASDPLVALTAGETYFYHLDGPFQFCHRLLQSRARRVYSTVYGLSDVLGATARFDLVFLGDVLLHTINPFQGLVEAARQCRGQLVIAQQMPGAPGDPAAIHYVGGDRLESDDLCWFLPNEGFFRQALAKLGFRTVEVAGHNRGALRPSGHPYERPILVASR